VRDVVRELIEQVVARYIFKNLKPGFKGFNSLNGSVCGRTRGEPTFRSVRKVPFAPVEAESVVDHYDSVVLRGNVGHKDDLPPIHVARPLVKHQHPDEVRSIRDFAWRKIGQKSVCCHHNAATVWTSL
jgi:hypothetical protein